MNSMMPPGFMLGNEPHKLAFMNLEDGSVEITMEESGERKSIARLDANGWASLVASVSKRGETSETWEAALKFHKQED